MRQLKISTALPYEKLLEFSRSQAWFAFIITDPDNFVAGFGSKRNLVLREPKGAFQSVSEFLSGAQSRVAGYLGYDLKNDIENLHSELPDFLDLPEACLFEPEVWVCASGNEVTLTGDPEWVDRLENHLKRENGFEKRKASPLDVRCTTNKNAYIESAEKLLAHIKRGNIYEVNYCVQFTAHSPIFDPQSRFEDLRQRTAAPFSVFARLSDRYILCASPERFLRHINGKLISQPIKGTIRRDGNPDVDRRLREQLRHDPKEISENVMIVDLVRNDLSRVAAGGTVKVDELCGIYPFKTVYHMISTVGAELDGQYRPLDAIRACFPAGSMTGAPKIRAMELIEELENFKRGPYAGNFGYFEPNGNFDLNVVIRTLIYNPHTHRIGFSVGSALTIGSHPEREFDECMLKAEALISALHGSLEDRTD